MDYVDELLDMIASDAVALNCQGEAEHARTIVREGSSADRQIDLFRLRRLDGEPVSAALRSVVQQTMEETRLGAAGPAPETPLIQGRKWC